ncbi:hypothetical protein ABIE78_000728 [Sinorhizobium fredii]
MTEKTQDPFKAIPRMAITIDLAIADENVAGR